MGFRHDTCRLISGILCFTALYASCASSIIEKAGWEGIRGRTLRVYIALEIPDDLGPAAIPDRMIERLMDSGKKRAELILEGYLRETITDPDRAGRLRAGITDIISSAVIVNHDCDEFICSAFLDFNLGETIGTEPSGR